MKLTLDEIRPLLFGALATKEKNGGLTMSRMSETTREGFLKQNPDFKGKTYTTAGVRLDVETDTETFTFRYADVRPGASYAQYAFDVAVDGDLCYHEQHHIEEQTEGAFTLSLSGGFHRITVYFPYLSIFTLVSVELSDGATFRPVTFRRRMLALGDSITHGHYAAHPALAYSVQVADALQAELCNQAIGAARFFADTLDEHPTFRPDLITVAYGTNDWCGGTCDMEAVRQHAADYLTKLSSLYPQIPVFVILPIWRADEEEKGSATGLPLDAVRDMLCDLCASVPCLYPIEGSTLVPHLPEFYEDLFLHPNDLGNVCYAKNLLAAIETYLPGEFPRN